MKFRLTDWNKSVLEFEFIGLRNDRNAFFLLTPTNERRCLLPYFPVPRGARLHRDPIPESAPVEIRPTRLMPPSCRANAAEATESATPNATSDLSPWENQYGEVLWPEVEDDGPLRERLNQFKATKAQEYTTKKAQFAAMTEPQARRLLGGDNSRPLMPDQFEEFRQKQRAELDKLYVSEAPSDIRLGGGYLNWTLEMVKAKNLGGLRDDYLHQKWARKHGFDLSAMKREKARFLEFVQRNIHNVTECDILTKQESAGLLLFTEEEEELCALVRYVLTFADGTRVWLARFELRPLLNARENQEFDLGRPTAFVQESIHLPAATHEFEELVLPDGMRVHPPRGVREILQALSRSGSSNVPCHILKHEVARVRGEKEMSESYSPAKVLKHSSVGRALLSAGVVTYPQLPGPGRGHYSLNLAGTRVAH
jgi:hypothetical protein